MFDGILQFEVDLVETGPIAALIIDQNVSVRALTTDVAGYVLLTAQDVDVAHTRVGVVVALALHAGGFFG